MNVHSLSFFVFPSIPLRPPSLPRFFLILYLFTTQFRSFPLVIRYSFLPCRFSFRTNLFYPLQPCLPLLPTPLFVPRLVRFYVVPLSLSLCPLHLVHFCEISEQTNSILRIVRLEFREAGLLDMGCSGDRRSLLDVLAGRRADSTYSDYRQECVVQSEKNRNPETRKSSSPNLSLRGDSGVSDSVGYTQSLAGSNKFYRRKKERTKLKAKGAVSIIVIGSAWV